MPSQHVTQRVVFHSRMISCDNCVTTIRKRFGKVHGVQSVTGDTRKREITVTFRPPSTLGGLFETMDSMGFRVDRLHR